MTHLKVAVRVRPLSAREVGLNLSPIVEVFDKTIVAVTNLKVPHENTGDSRERIRRFAFDYCFDQSSDQNEIFSVVEKEVENAIHNRYHSCVLAYGQSSSGKTHTMMGNIDDPGLIPRLCENLFLYLTDYPPDVCGKLQTTVSYLEIYNEKVHDLLVSKEEVQNCSRGTSLRIREHPKKGPYVQGLVQHTVYDPETLLRWLKIGNANRKVSATSTNLNSSRSHSVFTLTFGEGVQLHLIDLAGSERAANKYNNICTLKEGANINKSLVALGNVISTLADHSSKVRYSRKRFVPYRDSALTWLLKDTLGGNSKTTMIATVSPSTTCYNETINTLRFGQRAKKIESRPIVIDDPKESIIRELRVEIARLKEILAQFQDPNAPLQHPTESQNTVDNVILERSSSVTKSVRGKECGTNKVLIAEEVLLPVMNVSSAVRPEKKIRRTFSVESEIMNPKPTRAFGSQEAISSSTKRNSQPSVLAKKPTTKSAILRKASDATPKKVEKAMVTEVKGPQKIDPPKKNVSKQRSQIVAAVTNRLYGISKKKEVATETESIKSPSEEVPKELTICSNARMRLQELTHRALNAHRRKNVDTQTDLFPVLRVKEIATDVDDLKIALLEVKNAEVECMKIETKDVAVNCFEKTFEEVTDGHAANSFVYTKSCGTQVTDLSDDQKPRTPPQPSSVSFTKYLQSMKPPTIEIVNPSTGSPIYTSTVNINVSHNYINRHRLSDIASEDSIEESNQTSNVNLPTPDIISNHNSLEHGNMNVSPEPPLVPSQHFCEKCASFNTITEVLYSTKYFNVAPVSFCVAKCSITLKCQEKVKCILKTPVYASQTYFSSDKFREHAKPFYVYVPEVQARVSTTIDLPFSVAHEPVLLKSNIKRIATAKNVPKILEDSSDKRPLTSSDADKMLEAMSKFMEEATTLMRNLSNVTTKLQHAQEYDLEVLVNNVSEFPSMSSTNVQNFATQTCILEEASSQTTSYQDASANTDTIFQMPVNEYESAVRTSCNKLEECINRIENKAVPEIKFRDDLYIQNPLDYGVLTRQSLRRVPSCSPSAYLRQLTLMRQRIVNSSRDDLSTTSKLK